MTDNRPRPFLILPTPRPSPLIKTSSPRRDHIRLPPFERQQKRVDRLVRDLRQAFKSKRAALLNTARGIPPEEVLVIETIGSVDRFLETVKRIDGLEWLAEFAPSKVESDDDFYDDRDPSRPIAKHMYLTMTNQDALIRLQLLWTQYKRSGGKVIEKNYTPLRDLFNQLRDIRFWGKEDRLRGTHLRENIRLAIEYGADTVTFESELWYRPNAATRTERAKQFIELLNESGGELLYELTIDEIAYHSVLCRVPRDLALSIIDDGTDNLLVENSAVQYLRPTGQISAPVVFVSTDQPVLPPTSQSLEVFGNPQVALLDGLPLQNHQWLRDRIIVDDPDNWAGLYPASARAHGTAMASLLILGDANSQPTPAPRPIYVRPIMRPEQIGMDDTLRERMPQDILPLDLILRVFRRMFEGEEGGPPAAPNVKVVNFSIGDESTQFDRDLSPLARLFDWLSWRYNVLIIVSVGNYTDDIALPISNDDRIGLSDEDINSAILRAVASQIQQRRLLAPSEGLNVISVGAIHEDNSLFTDLPQIFWNDISMIGHPSPINRLGHGYGSSLKPEILIPGGRQTFRWKVGTPSESAKLRVSDNPNKPPGQLVAAPGTNPGQTNSAFYISGTSNAAAIGSRRASEIIDLVRDLPVDPSGHGIPEDWLPTVAKALLVHGAHWDSHDSFFRQSVSDGINPAKSRSYLSRFLGFGYLDVESTLECQDHRVTMLGYGAFDTEARHTVRLPIPNIFKSDPMWKRITITLAWISPINPHHRNYRQAALSIETKMEAFNSLLGVTGTDVDVNSTKRGTVQHLILEGKANSRLSTTDTLDIIVRCDERAGSLKGNEVRYAIAVTIEIDESLEVGLYEEMAARVYQDIPVSVPLSSP